MQRTLTGRVLAAVALVGLLAGVTACASDDKDSSSGGGGATTTAGASALGTPNPASGTPIKIGFVSDGKSANVDNSAEVPSAQATVKWINEYQGGLAGHPIELVTCETQAEQAKGTECAQKMIQANVAAVVFNQLAVGQQVWEPLRDAGIPTMITSAQDPVPLDTKSTFVLIDSLGTAQIPLGMAKEANAKRAVVVIMDVPGAKETFQRLAGPGFAEAGIAYETIGVAPGTADMTADLGKLATDGTGVVYVAGTDAFCIAAFDALHQTGYKGKVGAYNACISDALRQQAPPEILNGLVVNASAPIGVNDPSMQTMYAVMKKYGTSIPVEQPEVAGSFQAVTALKDGIEGIDANNVTRESIISTIKAMPSRDLQAAAGLQYRCNGKASNQYPAVCTRGVLVTTLDAKGNPSAYKIVGSSPIPD